MTTLNHVAYGAGPPVVVLHGLFGSARNWAGAAKRLASGHRVLVLDLPNHGDSPWTDSVDYPQMADRVRAFITDHGLGRPAVLGHSMGGKVAMTLALEDGDSVGALVVVDIAPVAHDYTLLDYVEAMQAVRLGGVARRAEVDAQLVEAVPDANVRAFLLHNLEAHGDGLRWRINLQALATSMEAISGFPAFPPGRAFTGPTLFIAGAESDTIRPDHAGAIGRLFPKTENVEIAGAGHWVHADAPEAFVEAVSAFLGRNAA